MNCKSIDPYKLFVWKTEAKKRKDLYITANNYGNDEEIEAIGEANLRIQPLITVLLISGRCHAKGSTLPKRIKAIKVSKAFKGYELVKPSYKQLCFHFWEQGAQKNGINVLVFVKKGIGARIKKQIVKAYQRIVQP